MHSFFCPHVNVNVQVVEKNYLFYYSCRIEIIGEDKDTKLYTLEPVMQDVLEIWEALGGNGKGGSWRKGM